MATPGGSIAAFVGARLPVALALALLLVGCSGGGSEGGSGAVLAIAGAEGPSANELAIYGVDGSELRTIAFTDPLIKLVQVGFPDRVIAEVRSEAGDIEPYVVDVTTGETAPIGSFGDFSEYNYQGQHHGGSRWATARLVTQSSEGALVIDLETMQTAELPVWGYQAEVRISPDDKLIAFGSEEFRIDVLDAATMQRVERFSTSADAYRTIGFSPDSTRVALTEIYQQNPRTENGVEVQTRVVVGDIATGKTIDVAVNGLARGWASDNALVIDSINGETADVVIVETGEIVASFPVAAARILDAWQRPWQVVSSDESVQLVEVMTGAESSFEPADPLEITYSGTFDLPDSRYLWLYVGGSIGALDQLGAAVVDLETGAVAPFSVAAEGSYFSPSSVSYSHDGSRAIAAANGVSFLLLADGSYSPLPAAQSASFCEDDRFVVTGLIREGTETELFDPDGLTPIANFGPTGSAVCVN